ncbi:MAG: FAD-dependent oxidoreductase [Acidobacteria bacterium RIFCSPLOWO2_12_FULL_65_11]|nr:MAG: FAD-dependent oxidoreductase [Acidobacteria bacterium RIFCSPLOWO2_02_FULL_64_15]OFW32655.1 MAG: FAD-dependent oxidoreductase [Acidobacteria bacterium RIFCSPLOWO2_12_FULL_65_11]
MNDPIVVVGAGPAGLTAAYELTKRGVRPLVFDGDTQVGGLAKTVVYKKFRFDIGGHRFFTKATAVRELWHELLGKDLLQRPRLSRIYYRGRFFDYPLKAVNVVTNLGLITSVVVLASYARARISPIHPEVSLEDWICNRFGRRLFNMFFKSYTEKVWGIPCSQIGAQWAAQRIKGLSLWTAVLSMLGGSREGQIKTLIHEFEYPRLGPGMMWEECRDRVVAAGGRVTLGSRVVELRHDGERVRTVVIEEGGVRYEQPVSHVISTMPVRHLVRALMPTAPEPVREAAERLTYRDFLTVALIVDQADVFPDNWIYIHDPSVRVGRVQNFKNWSPEMVPDPRLTCLGLEYFCSEGDDLWRMPDEALVTLATREAVAIGLVRPGTVTDATVLRVFKAYPVYDDGYLEALGTIREWLARFANLQLVGRNGMHKYNNQDHSMLTAMLAVRNLCGERHDLWEVNADQEYHEQEARREPAVSAGIAADVGRLAGTQPSVPRSIPVKRES